MSLTLHRADGTQRQIKGYRYAAPPPNAKRYSPRAARGSALPPRVDLRPFMTEVEDQGATSSCVANAVAGAYEYLVKRHWDEEAYDVSRLFIYYNARALSESEGADEGTFISNAIQSLQEYGACSEETWPYDTRKVNREPSAEAYEEASQFLIEDTLLIPNDLDAWRSVLAEGYPVIFGISLYKSFDRHKKRGVVPLPSQTEASRESHSGHAMLAVGYSDRDRCFIVRNSWGSRWGDAGYCYIPYDYLINPRFNDGDSWIIRQIEAVEIDEGTWGDDASILEDIDSALNELDEDAWMALNDALADTPLEARIALIMLHATGADGEISDEELEAVSESLHHTLELFGSDLDPMRVLKNALNALEDEELLHESVDLFGEYLPASALAAFVNEIQGLVEADGLDPDEEDFVYSLIEAWQIGGEDEGEE